jgi:D-Lysine 5,6-aminomutase TIM-barrel domain of alpha subunit
VSGESLSTQAERVRGLAADLAGRFSATARGAATIAQERAALRMLGVDGLDRDGRPLAATLVERYCGSDRGRLARGVILPFAVALLEYDLPARELALEGASGAIDLGLEAELLDRPERLAAAERLATSLLDAAMARFDANRTAAREMRSVLGSGAEPWLGVPLRSTEVAEAAKETRALVLEGADVIQVHVPASWEFAEARRLVGLETPGRFEPSGPSTARPAGRARPAAVVPLGRRRRRTAPRPDTSRLGDLPAAAGEQVPAGSQRGLSALRRAADEAAAARGCYASLMTVTPAFAAPEQAVVAAFERIDIVEADPIREIVEDNVDPERAIADHAFAHRLQARAGCRVLIGPGPLALGADVANRHPSDAATRAGRGLALQALGLELALADGLSADRLLLGSVPSWIAGEGDPAAVFLQTWLRRLLFPGQRLVVGPDSGPTASRAAIELVAALTGAPSALVVRGAGRGEVNAAMRDLDYAAAAARALGSSLGDGALHGSAAAGASLMLDAAVATLERLAGDGWGSLLGPVGSGSEAERLGRTAVVGRASGPTSGTRLLAGLV